MERLTEKFVFLAVGAVHIQGSSILTAGGEQFVTFHTFHVETFFLLKFFSFKTEKYDIGFIALTLIKKIIS